MECRTITFGIQLTTSYRSVIGRREYADVRSEVARTALHCAAAQHQLLKAFVPCLSMLHMML